MIKPTLWIHAAYKSKDGVTWVLDRTKSDASRSYQLAKMYIGDPFDDVDILRFKASEEVTRWTQRPVARVTTNEFDPLRMMPDVLKVVEWRLTEGVK